ncbi:hypothetical protein H6P81_006815 [Aristolochia fimbriata]|uniref:Flocculation protein n=1 Tax=Aristolochia fimbriata TaxID=158543 RepID=A0AAV7F137_ARIFI|nr:hypothetical protein H6P81_006815 [Aristolochia fimbriata]
MFNRTKEDFVVDSDGEGSDVENRDLENCINGPNINETDVQSSEAADVGRGGRSDSAGQRSIAERLRNVLRGDGEGDLVLQENDGEDSIFLWLQALDLQVIGACRADERLKPLLKLNVSSGVAEDRLLAHLSQHFEAAEVGMLARCLCVPLVSLRVGKVIKQGNLLTPTTIRGQLNLILLPSSDLHVSFIGDDGSNERLTVLNSTIEGSEVSIEEISADTSGRTFLIKVPGSQVSYFWCAEKSQPLGIELLGKMKDLLRTKPTLAQLTGISELRLDCFAIHLRAYLFGSASATHSDSTSLHVAVSEPIEPDSSMLSNPLSSKPSRHRSAVGYQAKPHSSLYQASLSPRSNTFKDGSPRNSHLTRGAIREKLRRHSDSLCSLSADGSSLASSQQCLSSQSGDEQIQDHGDVPLSLPLTIGPSCIPSVCPVPLCLPSQLPPSCSSSLFSPYYCWCPPCTSTLQYTVTAPHLPPASSDTLSLPPLSTLLSVATRSSSSAIPPVKLPVDSTEQTLLPDPLFRFPLPVPPFMAIPSSQQLPTFTPFISDPIVHIPVVDVCSSGQGYLVSAGPAISTTISPLLPSLVNHPLLPETESVVEKGARDTLRLLMSSTQTCPPLLEMLPAVFSGMEENIQCIPGNRPIDPSVIVNVGSRGLYSGMRDVDAIASSMSVLGIIPFPGACKKDDDKSDGTRSCNAQDEKALEEVGSRDFFDDRERLAD